MPFDDGTFGSHSTPEMIRVARLATPVLEWYRFTVTADDRTWSFYYDQWHAVGPRCGLVEFSEEQMRRMLCEQLSAFNIGEAHPLWTEH